MKKLVLGLALLVPAAVLGQQANAAKEIAADAAAATAGAEIFSGAEPPQTKAQSAPKTTPPDSEVKRPKGEGSMVGYIEDATIGSKFRIRFDAAFDNPFPDRAEFFYAKCGCYKLLAPLVPGAFDNNAPGPGPGVPRTVNFQQLYFLGEYAFSRRFSGFIEVPFRWLQPQDFVVFTPFSNQHGISDIRIGVKAGLVESESTSVTFQLKGLLPSGDGKSGMGTNHSSIEPALLFYHRVSPRWSVEGQFGDTHPIGGSRGVPTASSERFAGDVLFYGFGPSVRAYSHNGVGIAPVLELVGWHVIGGFQSQVGGPVLGVAKSAGGTNIVNLKFGVRTTIRYRNSIYVGYGRALTDAKWYQDVLRLEYRRVF